MFSKVITITLVNLRILHGAFLDFQSLLPFVIKNNEIFVHYLV